jgi:hypothetical protein
VTTRDRSLIAVVVGVALLGLFWFMAIKPKRAEVAKTQSDIAAQTKTLAKATAQVQAGLQSRGAYGRAFSMVARLGQAVPADDSVPSLVYQLNSAATASGVDFRGVTLKPASSTAPSSSSSASSAPATQAATATLPPGAAVGPAGFPTMPFELTFDGSFFHMAGFLRRLDRFVAAGGKTVRIGGRLLTIEGIALSPGRTGFPQVKATVNATAYLVPAAEGAAAGATSSGPSSGSSASASTSSDTSSATPSATVTP